jgi:hypothetical protein
MEKPPAGLFIQKIQFSPRTEVNQSLSPAISSNASRCQPDFENLLFDQANTGPTSHIACAQMHASTHERYSASEFADLLMR